LAFKAIETHEHAGDFPKNRAVVTLPQVVPPNAISEMPVMLKESAAEPMAPLWLSVVNATASLDPLNIQIYALNRARRAT
jgi:hypothetical protein